MRSGRIPLWPILLLGSMLPASYILADGLGIYAVAMGWIDMDTFLAIWGPLPELFGGPGVYAIDVYEAWWIALANSHGGRAL